MAVSVVYWHFAFFPFHSVPETYLDEAIGMSRNDGDVAGLWLGVVLGGVLLDGEVEDFLLRVGRCSGILANVLRLASALLNVEE